LVQFIPRRVNTPTFRSDILKRHKQAQPASRLEIPRCSAAGCQFHFDQKLVISPIIKIAIYKKNIDKLAKKDFHHPAVYYFFPKYAINKLYSYKFTHLRRIGSMIFRFQVDDLFCKKNGVNLNLITSGAKLIVESLGFEVTVPEDDEDDFFLIKNERIIVSTDPKDSKNLVFVRNHDVIIICKAEYNWVEMTQWFYITSGDNIPREEFPNIMTQIIG
jgi:hypothetical protein